MHKIKFIKNFSVLLIIIVFFTSSTSSFASALGSTLIDGYDMPIGEGTRFYHNTFYSDQSGVGPQVENYITYSPNNTVIPTITNGDFLFGSSTLSKEVKRLESLSHDVLASSNADFFSFQTGVPMSNAIVDGKILTKDATGQDAIGFLDDGTAFISYFSISSHLIKEDGSSIEIHNINKYRQPYAIYMMTDAFSNETQNTTKGIDVVLGEIDGEMKLGTSLTAVVESVTERTGSHEIPKGKFVLTVDSNAPSEFYDPIANLTEGEEITIEFSVAGDSRWNDVVLGMGSVGGRLLSKGIVNPSLATGASPRTAIGTKDDGSIILYTIDGRQNGYSYGVQLKTLANRMKELGCTDAINLDGGGSTAISVQLPGNNSASLINKPSEGKERSVSTFFNFLNNAPITGELSNLYIYPRTSYVLKGASIQLSTYGTDAGFHPVSLKKIKYSVESKKNSTVSDSGVFTALDDGPVEVFVEAKGIKGKIEILCFETPTDIHVKNNQNGNAIKNLNLDISESISLSAEAYSGFNKLISENDNFEWSADDEIGSFNGQTFTSSENFGAEGNIYVKAGEKTITIPVKIRDNIKSLYPTMDLNFFDNAISGTIWCDKAAKINEQDIHVRIDGKNSEFEYDSDTGKFEVKIPDDAKKITIFATSENGNSNCGMYYTENKNTLENPFSDTSNHWAEGILNYMYANKIINGETVDGVLRFNPQKHMNRAEFAVMVCNYLGIDVNEYSNIDLPYSDVESIPAWAENSFKALYELGIVTGRYVTETERCADPLASINRAEAATIVARTLPSGFMEIPITAPDKADIPDWATDGINVLVKFGAMNGYEDGSFLPMQKLTKAEAAKILYSVM